MTSPIVSVIIPVYNAGDSLHDCLRSVLAQTLHDIEVVCVLDCPTDGSDQAVKHYAQTDTRIRIVENNTNQHIGNSRNTGLGEARGKYVAFCDDDDTMVADFLETMVQIAEQTDAPFVASYDTYWHAAEQNESTACDTREAYLSILSGKAELYSPSVWTYLYRRDFLLENSITFVDTRYVAIEDRLFNAMAMATAIQRGMVTYPLAKRHLYLHKTEHTNGNYTYRKMENILAMLEQMGQTDQLFETEGKSIVKHVIPYTECIAVFMYGSLKMEIRKNGLCRSMRKLHLIQEYPLVRNSLRACHLRYNSRLTPPKNMLLWILKVLYIR